MVDPERLKAGRNHIAYTHGYSYHRLYTIWDAMKSRCYRKKSIGFERYGGRGIRICREWFDKPAAFIDWAKTNGWEEGLQIDRINNDGDYRPDNCRFVTNGMNQLNTRPRGEVPYVGVSLDRAYNGYRTLIKYNKKILYRKRSKCLFTAVVERDEYIIEHNLPHKLNILVKQPE